MAYTQKKSINTKTLAIKKEGRVLALILIGILLAGLDVLHAQIDRTLNYQGLLTHADGQQMHEQTMLITFQLYSQPTGGLALWSESQTVDLNEGIFNVVLGKINPLDIDFGQQLWLGIQIEGSTELTARTELTAAPQALAVAPGAAVQSINGLRDAVEIVPGDNVTISRKQGKITISSEAGGGAGGSGDITPETYPASHPLIVKPGKNHNRGFENSIKKLQNQNKYDEPFYFMS